MRTFILNTAVSAALLLVAGQAAPSSAPTLFQDKTLVVWAAPANLTQQPGSALTIADGQSHFDGIILGEIAPRKWMPGSDNFRRTLQAQGSWPTNLPAQQTPPPFVQIHPKLESFVEDIPPSLDNYYREAYRPQFHFSSYSNWCSDPNGLVHYDGTYHLFFQYNPFGLASAVPFWGHAVSKDLVHWTQKPCVFPVSSSGSAVVDWKNTAGLQNGDKPPIIAFRGNASGGYGIVRFAYSTDNALTWREYQSEPRLLDHADPKVFWHEPTRRWIMISFTWPNDRFTFRFYSSSDLKHWRLESTLKHEYSECPDLYELALDGDPSRRKWVFNVGNGAYDIGHFDGKRFTIEYGRYRLDHGNFYASQSWANIPRSDGRTIQVAWLYGAEAHPEKSFNQQHTFPCELTLRTCPEGMRVCRQPVREIEALHDKEYQWQNLALKPGDNPLAALRGDLFDIIGEFDLGTASEVGLDIREHPLRVLVGEKQVTFRGSSVPVSIERHRLRLRVLVDRSSVETFVNQGQSALTRAFWPKPEADTLRAYAKGGEATILFLKIRTLKSAWTQR